LRIEIPPAILLEMADMNLDDTQKIKVSQWIQQGLKVSEIQDRMFKELEIRISYMELRLLLSELSLTPKDPAPAPPPKPLPAKAVPAESALADPEDDLPEDADLGAEDLPDSSSAVSVSVDQLAYPGTVVSGKVTFSDGVTAVWRIDQQGRTGLAPSQPGYRPNPADMAAFQQGLSRELRKLGYC
jgi:hypothetical protein